LAFSSNSEYIAATVSNGPPAVVVWHLDREGPLLSAFKVLPDEYGPLTDMFPLVFYA
jgi:hypothetical protein